MQPRSGFRPDIRPRIRLLIIDPQNDFCDLPASLAFTPPALPVAGAHADMQRLAAFIRAGLGAISDLVITLDSHHRFDIAHPPFWQQVSGSSVRPVVPFTSISAQQVREGQFRPRDALTLDRVLAYLDALQAQGRYTLMVWPVHCEIGTWGHNVHAQVQAACAHWQDTHLRPVQYVHKGANPWTEHYSALQAEVPDEQDPHTQLNPELLAQWDDADLLLIAGQASSHCVKATTEHLVDYLPSQQINKMVLLTDCMSAVAGFEAQAQDFFTAMRARGVQLSTSIEMLEKIQK